jgi:hypothetical protein
MRSPWPAALWVALALPAGCGSTPAATTPRPPPGARVVIFEGTCDASGAVPLDGHLFVVADDEDNVLRVYDADRGGPPLSVTDVSGALALPIVGKKRPRPAEMDLEGATRLGEHAWWLASHGRNARGDVRRERLKLFATTLPAGGTALDLVGHSYDRLLDDLVSAESLAPFGLATAAQLAPKEPGGLNIEGLTATPDGQLLLAFRNPVPRGRALLVPLLNPDELLRADDADPARRGGVEVRARLGEAIQLDLAGQGVRSLSWWRGRYLIIAGAVGSGGVSHLYAWTGGEAAPAASSADLSWLNPEGFFSSDERDEVLLLSDDGEVEIDGKACKRLKDPARKRFRGVWVAPP